MQMSSKCCSVPLMYQNRTANASGNTSASSLLLLRVILNAWTPKARCADLLNDMITRQGDLWPHAAITSDLSHNRTSLLRNRGVAIRSRERSGIKGESP